MKKKLILVPLSLGLVIGVLAGINGCNQQQEVVRVPAAASVGEVTATKDLGETVVEASELPPANPLVEPRPTDGALLANTMNNENIRQRDERTGEWTRVERFYEIPLAAGKVVKPTYKGGTNEYIVIEGVVPACEILEQDCELQVNDYAVTAEAIDGVHKVISTKCVNEVLLGKDNNSCPEGVIVRCEPLSPKSCQFAKLGRPLFEAEAALATSNVEVVAEQLTCPDEVRALKELNAQLQAKLAAHEK